MTSLVPLNTSTESAASGILAVSSLADRRSSRASRASPRTTPSYSRRQRQSPEARLSGIAAGLCLLDTAGGSGGPKGDRKPPRRGGGFARCWCQRGFEPLKESRSPSRAGLGTSSVSSVFVDCDLVSSVSE